ncbi:MAG TPA: PLD nuclease N-terminal domain-containing protein [Paracoccaceae bacterium]|nr:PLD nuclease N-terminal domain-containing protein [Paracoccaceae bacterium]
MMGHGINGFWGLIILVLDIWAIISIIGSRETTGAKTVWVLVILFLPLVGFLIWLFAGPKADKK